MKPFSIATVLFALITLGSVLVWAASPPEGAEVKKTEEAKKPETKKVTEEPENVVSGVKMVVKLFKEHKWRPAIAALLTLIIFFWRRFIGKLLIAKIPAKYMAWVTAGIGLLATLPAHLMVEKFNIWTFLLDGFVTGAEAAILWSLVGKHLLPKVFGEVKAENGKG